MYLKFVDMHIYVSKEPTSVKNLVRRIPVGSKMDASTCDTLCFKISRLPVVTALQYDHFYAYL
jgi:hypothetical protein